MGTCPACCRVSSIPGLYPHGCEDRKHLQTRLDVPWGKTIPAENHRSGCTEGARRPESEGRGDRVFVSLRKLGFKEESLRQPWRLEQALILSPHLGRNRPPSGAASRPLPHTSTRRRWRRAREPVTHLVKILAEQGSGLRGREVAELGHEVHLTLGQQGGRRPQHPLAARDGLILVFDGSIQGLDGLVQLEQRPLLLRDTGGRGRGGPGAHTTHTHSPDDGPGQTAPAPSHGGDALSPHPELTAHPKCP